MVHVFTYFLYFQYIYSGKQTVTCLRVTHNFQHKISVASVYLPRGQIQPKFLSHISHTKLYTKEVNGVEGVLYSMAHWLENSLVK